MTSSKSKKQIALVAGSSRGIGAGIARYLMQKGFFVYVTYCQNLGRAKQVCKNQTHCKILHLDLTLEQAVKDAFNIIKQDFGYLNLLVNNANIEIPGTTEDITLEVWKKNFSDQSLWHILNHQIRYPSNEEASQEYPH